MKTSMIVVLICAVTGIAVLLSGCQTYGEGAAAGAAGGAATGAIIGHQSGHKEQGAVIGAVLGGLAGLIAHDVKDRRTRDKRTTVSQYNYESQQGEMLEIEDAQIYPKIVRPGRMAEATIQYALLGTRGRGAQVLETRTLKRGDEVLAELSAKNFTRSDGTFVSTLPFRLPEDLEPGEYTIVQRVETQKAHISSNLKFEVSER